jgi:hypothetical protein
MYCSLPYVYGGALLLKALVLSIYWPRGTMRYITQLCTIYSFYNFVPKIQLLQITIFSSI